MAGVYTAVVLMIGSMLSRWVVGRDFKGKLEAQGKKLEAQGKKFEALGKELQEERLKHIAEKSVLESRLSALEAELRTSRTPSLATEGGADPSGSDSLADLKKIWEASPGAGRTAAQLIMVAPTVEEARQIYDGFRAAPQRENAAQANWAFLCQLDKSGQEQEVFDLAFELTGREEDLNVDDETAEEFIRLRQQVKGDGES